MQNWEEHLQRLWQAIRDRITTPEAVFLGVCAYLSGQFGIPVAAVRLVLVICAYYLPITTLIAYIAARLLIEVSGGNSS